MDTESANVIVTPNPASKGAEVHHRDFPEIRAEGGSVEEAAAYLINHMTRALDTALTDWRRGAINQAIADVKAFMSTHSHSHGS